MRAQLLASGILAFVLLGCIQTGPSESEYALQTQVSSQATQIGALQDQQFRATWEAAKTATALAQAPAPTPVGPQDTPTEEPPTPTEIPPTATPVPPTATSRVPTATPVPSVETIQRNETQQIGPIWDSLHDEDFSMEVTLKSIDWLRRDTYNEPRPGHVFVIVHLRIVNLGPGASRSISDMDFQVLDANGALRGTDLVMAAIDCRLGLVDLTVGGSVEGCAGFEVPDQGKVDLIYAPFRYEGLEPGRYLSFNLRP